MIRSLVAMTFLFHSLSAFCVTISTAGSREVAEAPSEFFTGKVKVERITKEEAPSKMSSALVIFSKGARSAWHTHPLGQLLIVKKGRGRIQAWDKPMQVIKEGDVIWTPPGEKHWHGAAPDSEMSHFAIQEVVNDEAVRWLEKVTDEQYKNIK